jgi:predicted dehydrogenase
MQRRHFLVTSAGALTAASSVFGNPSDTLRMAVVGIGGRGKNHITSFSALPDVEITAICDIDDSHLAAGVKQMAGLGKKEPQTYKDIRKLLENKDIDFISIATPNHWHTLISIWAMQHGKDVYVEKPCAYNIFEAKQIVAAARKYDRIVQQGSQIRSSEAVREGIQKMHEGLIGDVYLSRGLCFKWRDTIGHKPVEPIPAGVDYDLWTGPSPMHQFTMNRFHYNWHWFWDTGNGDLGNQGIHEVDVARWGLGVKFPVKVSAIGGHFMFDDDQETPNTLNCAFEFADNGRRQMMEFEVRHWMSNGEATVGPTPRTDPAPAAAGGRPRGTDSIGNLFYGSKGFMDVDSYSSYKTWLGKEQAAGPANKDADPMKAHVTNFVDAVRAHKREMLHAEVEEGAASTVLVHLANISYRVGRTINFDSKNFTCIGDSEANKYLSREYRKPFVVPEKV